MKRALAAIVMLAACLTVTGPAQADDRIAVTGTCFAKWKFYRILNSASTGQHWTHRRVRAFTQVFVSRRAYGTDTKYRIAYMYPGCPNRRGWETEVRISYNRATGLIKVMVWRAFPFRTQRVCATSGSGATSRTHRARCSSR